RASRRLSGPCRCASRSPPCNRLRSDAPPGSTWDTDTRTCSCKSPCIALRYASRPWHLLFEVGLKRCGETPVQRTPPPHGFQERSAGEMPAEKVDGKRERAISLGFAVRLAAMSRKGVIGAGILVDRHAR